MTRQYNQGGSTSDIGQGTPVATQLQEFYFQKKALIEAQKEQYFSQLADVTAMPKHMGKKIKRYIYLPLLDDGNLNDQGIDANGLTITSTMRYVAFPSFIAVANAGATALRDAINANIDSATGTAVAYATAGAAESGGTGKTLITLSKREGIKYASSTQTAPLEAANIGAVVQEARGNLYGSSKDIGLINGKMPVLSENGGKVNRVGFKRKEIEGTFEKFGFFDEYTQESVDFDSDEELMTHVNREMVMGANEMTEDALQIDLLTSAGTVKFPGAASSPQTLTDTTMVDYLTLMRLNQDLDNNRTPQQTTVITGTRLVDTKVLPGGRVAYCGHEVLRTLKEMKDLHNNPAWIPVEKYAAGGTTLRGEKGAIDSTRFVVVPEMMKWSGAGGDATGTATHYETGGRYDVFPILIVGEGSFTTIGFQTDGKSVKFTITHKKPGKETADRNDPYGETGFMSIKWYYGFMALRAERIGLIKTTAKM